MIISNFGCPSGSDFKELIPQDTLGVKDEIELILRVFKVGRKIKFLGMLLIAS
tara:strand:+ start:536 stop:694 length:159 start_codon:yes stop_codon:yes gene_type:complete